MLSLINKLKKQKEAEEEKHRQNKETAKIYAQYVKSFDGKNQDEPLKFVQSDVYDPSTGTTDTSSAKIITLGEKGESEPDQDKDELSASYLSQIEQTESTVKKQPKTAKVREIDTFIEEIKEKQRVINERKELHEKILSATSEYERYEISQKLSQLDSDPNLNVPDLSSTNIYVGNLSPNITEDILRMEFCKYGQIVGIRVMPVKNEGSYRPLTSAFVSFLTHQQAEKAKNMMDGKEILNLPCKIGWAKNLIKPVYPQQESPPFPQFQVPFNTLPIASPPFVDPNFQNIPFLQVLPPIPYQKKKIIDLMSKYVSEAGQEFEQMIMEKERPDGLFSFLFEKYTPESVYYRWRVYSLLQGDSLREWNTNSFKITNFGKIYNPPMPQNEADNMTNGFKYGTSQSGYTPLTEEKEREMEDILENATSTRNDVSTAMLFIINNSESAYHLTDKLVNKFLETTGPTNNKMALLYILSDVLYNSSSSRQYAWIYRTSIEKRLPEIFEGIRNFKSKSTSKIASQQLVDAIMKLFRMWEEWKVYPPPFMKGLEATLLGTDIESFQTSPEFSKCRELESQSDGEEVDYYEVLSKFPYRFREDAYKYLLMGIKELRSLCSQRGLLGLPADRVTLVKRLVMYDKYQYDKKVSEEKRRQMLKEEEESRMNDNEVVESDSEGSDMDQDSDQMETIERSKIQKATEELRKALMKRTSSPPKEDKDKESDKYNDGNIKNPPKKKEKTEDEPSPELSVSPSPEEPVAKEPEVPEDDQDDIDDIFAT